MVPAAMMLQLYGSYRQAAAQNRANLFNQFILGENARIARMNAGQARLAGDTMASRAEGQGTMAESAATAAAGASGVDVQSKSVVDVNAGTSGVAQQDANMIQHNALLKALGYEMEAKGLDMNRSLLEQRRASDTEATILGGVTRASATAYNAGLFFGRGGGSDASDSPWPISGDMGGSY